MLINDGGLRSDLFRRVLLICLSSAVGCASTESVVLKRASKDFGCGPDQIAVEQEKGLFLARGCNRVQGYQVTGEWGSRWAVPCDSTQPYRLFETASPELCAQVLGDRAK